MLALVVASFHRTRLWCSRWSCWRRNNVVLLDDLNEQASRQTELPLKTALRLVIGVTIALTRQACAVVAVADAAVTVVATGVKVTAKAVGAVASAVIP